MTAKYLKYRRSAAFSVVSACLLFGAVMLLSGSSPQNTLYALFIYLFVVGTSAVFDFIAFRRRMQALSDILSNVSETNHDFPEAGDAIEKLYDEIISATCSVMRKERDDFSAHGLEQVEYYTMWLHQIKTPIAAMRLALESSETDDPVLAQELLKIERYVDMALQYAKLGSPGCDVVLRPTEIDPIVVASIKKYAPLFFYKNLSVDFTRTGLTVPGDEKWLAFIIEQFLCNCAKYTNAGGVRIYAQDGALVISDSGAGISAEDLPRVFEKGYTGYNGRMDKRASGLGLYMASMAAKKTGVRLSLTSAPGKGATASIVFSTQIEIMDAKLTKL